MQTDALIAGLADDLSPIPAGAVARRLIIGLGLGALGSVAVMLAWLGLRPDLAAAVMTVMFWMKLAYALATGLVLAAALGRLARPAAKLGGLATLVVAPFAVMVALAVTRLMQAEPAAWSSLVLGASYNLCPVRIMAIGAPVLAGAVWALRGLAPTRLTLAGLAAGGCAGGLGAAVYAFACDETAAPFVAIWYTLGMGLVAAMGGLAGSRWLRWR